MSRDGRAVISCNQLVTDNQFTLERMPYEGRWVEVGRNGSHL